MLLVTYSTERRGSITKLLPVENFPIDAIIKLVNSGVTVTINSAPKTLSVTDSVSTHPRANH